MLIALALLTQAVTLDANTYVAARTCAADPPTFARMSCAATAPLAPFRMSNTATVDRPPFGTLRGLTSLAVGVVCVGDARGSVAARTPLLGRGLPRY